MKKEITLIPGQRKKRPKGTPEPRLSTHKSRSIWFQSRTTWPQREASSEMLVRERRQADESLAPAPGLDQWQSVGPTNIGGRMTSLAVHPSQPDLIWAGTAGGGVWKSDDAGRNWRALWHKQEVLNVGSLALDPQNPDVIYCGTGEANLSADSYPGVGIYRSTDGGESWNLLASSRETGIPRRIGVIAIDPFDSNHVRIGGVTHSPSEPGGMYVSHDGGETWTREDFLSSQNYRCHAICFHPARRGTIFAAFTERGVRSGIWRSEDGGTTWVQLNRGLPPPESFGRTSLAIAPSNPKIVYALSANDREGVLGVFRSGNLGESWKAISGSHFRFETQMSYGNTIAVHPKRSDCVLCGGVDLHRTTNAGRTWQKVTRWNARRGASNYAHADHHCLVMPAGGRVYDANDGGLDVSEDGGTGWSNRSAGLAVTMYYDLDVAPSDGRNYGGGTQDNGTLVTTTGSVDDHFEILGGDGGWMVYDPNDALHIYASYYNMNIFRFRFGQWTDVTPPASDRERGSVWMVFITMDPSDPNVVFTGSQRVWRTRNDGKTWTAVSPVLDGSAISAIEVAHADPKRIYVGTENGGVFRSLDGGDSWTGNLASSTLPGLIITRIETSPHNAGLLFASTGGADNSHVFRSDDGGLHWTDADRGQLPKVPHHALAIPPDEPNSLYAANDSGVYLSPDLGGTWLNITRNLPNTMVVDLVYHQKDGALSVATYGRSIWRLRTRPGDA